MTDCLVKLYNLPSQEALNSDDRVSDIKVARAMAYEKCKIVKWVEEHFSDGWSAECSIAFSRQPITCFIATHRQRLVGFACHETIQKNFFGPIGVCEEMRGHGIGSRLLLRSLQAMGELGYAYAIIGGVATDNLAFYRNTVNAIAIEGSDPGVYTERILT